MSKFNMSLMRTLVDMGSWIGDPCTYDIYRTKNDVFMPLVVEHVPHNLNGGYMVAISHYTKQNGDTMFDPMVKIWVRGGSDCIPVSYRNDFTGMNETYVKCTNGELYINQPEVDSLKKFCNIWARNIKHQGYVMELMA